MTRSGRFRFLFGLSLAGFAACGGNPDNIRDDECTPGESAACTCENGLRGARRCDDSGSFGSCVCATGTGGGSTGGSTALGGTQTGGTSIGGASTGGQSGTGAGNSSGGGGKGGTPPIPLCQPGCTTSADCGSPSLPAQDADNYACRDGLCVYLGCLSDAECNAQVPGYLCRLFPLSGVNGCVESCTTPADCAVEGTATYDADNYTCDNGGCTIHGCNNDAECEHDLPGRVCRPTSTGENSCWEPCTAAADCTLGGMPFDADNFACEAGLCVYIGCHNDAECTSVAGTYVCR